ncbi:MAG: AAA family ATPase [Alphaproteobacteria bacterium]|nr:AAA family ATPase [Alphaproteobacteria bacterium]
MQLNIPDFALVVLIGASGSGQSSFAARHFRPTEVLSSDRCRGWVADDETDQSATPDAFEVLHFLAGKRLAGRRLTVVDLTLRSALAIRWIRDRAEAPPMDVGALAGGLNLPEGLLEQLQHFIAPKALGTEDALTPRSAKFDEFITDALSMPAPRPAAPASEAISARADEFFATLVLDGKNKLGRRDRKRQLRGVLRSAW